MTEQEIVRVLAAMRDAWKAMQKDYPTPEESVTADVVARCLWHLSTSLSFPEAVVKAYKP
jgi:hypothetical protein